MREAEKGEAKVISTPHTGRGYRLVRQRDVDSDGIFVRYIAGKFYNVTLVSGQHFYILSPWTIPLEHFTFYNLYEWPPSVVVAR
jgi:hypothetical protein